MWLHPGREGQGVLHHRPGGVQHRGLLLLRGRLQLCQHVSQAVDRHERHERNLLVDLMLIG